ncbi:MAG TPA: pilus assembly PilX N-terminal domain-containing protein, partial [Terriglobia bacterium]|nr:pilus assembly PilX N-terminal domain-containing protein [Terriglobia bacterium]
LLVLMTVVGLAMVISLSSDMLINGYYRNYRGAYYAADSGLSVARQQLVNQIAAQVPVAFATPPLPASAAATVQNYITTNYGAAYVSLNTGQATSSWDGSFEIPSVSFTQASCTVTASGSTPAGTCAADSKATAYQYVFNYSISSSGRALASQLSTVQETGNITLNVTGTPSSASFAAWGMFIDQQPICDGSYLVPGTISGPVFTNGSWTFGTTGSYIFTDPVGSAGSQAGYQFGSCYQSTAGTYTSGGQQIKPNFQAGYTWGQTALALPANDYSQKYAAIDGKGTGESIATPTAAQWHTILNGAMKNISGTAYPTGGAASGVYLPYASVSGTNTVTGGGIYVEGTADSVIVSPGTDASGNPTQVYTIKQGATTTTVTTNPTANTTTMKSGGTTQILAGVPENLNVMPNQPATMLYVNGSITALSGPGQGNPAIQNASQVTITAENDITVTGDLLYTTEPVTFTTNQIPGTPADTLIPSNNTGQTLGVFTATGNINLNNKQSNGNLEIDASLATISTGGSGGLVNTGNSINTLNIVGGRIQSTIQNINTTTRNVFFDRRFAPGSNFAPPWFPSTTLSGSSTTHSTIASIQRVSWAASPQ